MFLCSNSFIFFHFHKKYSLSYFKDKTLVLFHHPFSHLHVTICYPQRTYILVSLALESARKLKRNQRVDFPCLLQPFVLTIVGQLKNVSETKWDSGTNSNSSTIFISRNSIEVKHWRKKSHVYVVGFCSTLLLLKGIEPIYILTKEIINAGHAVRLWSHLCW
jgi:hypothetical protein